MTLGQKIKQARESKYLSQEELAEKLGVSRQAVSKWENDNAIPQGLNRELMSQVLGLDLTSSETENSYKHKMNLWGWLGWGIVIILTVLLVTIICTRNNDKKISGKETETVTENNAEIQGLEIPSAFPMELIFASGAGGWSTVISLYEDGHFNGQYMDVEMGTRDEIDFPNGTIYVSEFSGQFENITQIGDFTYYMSLHELAVSTLDGDEWFVDGTRYIGTEPYGFEQGREFILHTPQMPVEGLPERFLSWWPSWLFTESELERPEKLSCYGLYNMEMGYGFFTYGEDYNAEPGFNENSTEPAAIETLTFGSTYKDMTSLGEPNSITPIDDESIIINKGHYVTAEYDGLTVTLSAKEDFTLTPVSNIVAITAVADTYTDSRGLKVGTSKEELMQKYSMSESDFLSGKENEEQYHIHNNFMTHDIPAYDSFYVSDDGEIPVILIYLIKDDCINGILLRHLTAD